MNNSNLSPKDLEILKRLEKLREDDNRGSGTSDDAIRERLAALRGQTYLPEQKQVLKPDKRSDQQKCDDLIAQLAEECTIDQMDKNRDIEIRKRLDELKDIEKTNPTAVSTSNENEIQRVIQQAILVPTDDEDSDGEAKDSDNEDSNSEIESSDDELSDDD